MNTLNKEIKELELQILSRLNNSNTLKANLERDKLTIKNDLDPKDKAFSNEEKREFYVCELPQVKKSTEYLKVYEYETDILKIDLKYKLRELEICLAMHNLKEDMFK